MELITQELTTRSVGGTGGTPFNMQGIKTLQLRSGRFVDAIIINDVHYGGKGGDLSEKISLAPDEYIDKISLRHGHFVDRVEITTNKGQRLAGGGNGGDLTTLEGKIVAFGGRHEDYLNRLDVFGVFN